MLTSSGTSNLELLIVANPSKVVSSKNFTLTSIEGPDDDLIFALVLKNLSDRQISIDKKLIDYIIKRIDRSYSNISDFIYTIDQLSLKKKKSIDFKIIKEALGD